MIAAFYRHLNKNGVGPDQITVLTFYNGQRKRILKELRSFSDITAGYLQVKTVDSYQGEENNVVILSLTRSNEDGKIGFLANINRVCVALSRAKFGFYLFGNATALMAGSELWYNVVQRMRADPKRLDKVLPVRCKNHGVTCLMQYPEDWANTEGGCRNPCDTVLECGHQCPLWCHPYSHDKVECPEDCRKKLPCSHGCDRKCSQPCYCSCDEFVRFQKLDNEKAWSMSEPSAVVHGMQDIRVSQGYNGQSVPSSGSASYLQQQLPGPRNSGPSYRDAILDSCAVVSPDRPGIDPKHNANMKPIPTFHKVGLAWNPTPAEAIKTHQLSPEKQQERRQGWKSFATGGVVADDQRLGALGSFPSMPTNSIKASRGSSRDLTVTSTGTVPSDNYRATTSKFPSPIRKETITTVDGGRSRFLQEYRPEATRWGRHLPSENQNKSKLGQPKKKPPSPGLRGGDGNAGHGVKLTGAEGAPLSSEHVEKAGSDVLDDLAALDAYYRNG